ncbi:MAG: hypothetical protein ACRCZS_20880 [Chroococcidiopsis sp.]
MTQLHKSGKEILDDYIRACGYGLTSPDSKVGPPVVRTGDAVKDYIAAVGYGSKKL